ncbi:MAG: phosphatase PAP2 family protein [Anaerolineales bacterium]|nr:phosphatase PAP2 family protein [Anaerolineales bacterium]
MQVFIESGIAFIIALQNTVGDWFIAPMRFFSYLGNEEFFLLVLPLIYWSVDSALGLRVGFILLTSNLFNNIGKLIFAGPRPYWVSSHVRALWSTETSFGIPSGHAQLAVSVWGMVAVYSRRTWIWVVSLTVIFLIGFSRIFLGVHFPHDVVFGWLLGAVILWAFTRFWEPVGAWVGQKTLSQQILIAFVVSLIFIVLGFGASTLRSGYQIPETWTSNALLAGTDLPDPVDPNSTFTSAGTLFGLAAGAAWIMSTGGYQASGPVEKRAIRYVIGLIGVLILYMGLGAIFPRGDGFIFYLLRYIRYALLGWWVSGGAPWVFVRFKLAERADTI